MAAGDYTAATRHHVREATPGLETTDSYFDEIDQLLWREWRSHQQLFLNDAYCARIAFYNSWILTAFYLTYDVPHVGLLILIPKTIRLYSDCLSSGPN